ncbi:hypothetical protein [Streptosporangium sp. NPDC087985]|uniref:hypothetical protein n=1 Tax=Streptosporangium sp. NPDC087985 TaxID=3366196 RepID=UPI00381927E9
MQQQPDPAGVHTLPELAEALQTLRAGRTYKDLDRAAAPERLPSSTLSDMLNSGRSTVETLELFLRACGVPREQHAAWLSARERATSANLPGTAGLVRVADADPRRLGVHAAIDAPGATGDLPAYFTRDTDLDPKGIRARIAQATEGRGGMIVLVGWSSVGKTRCAYEAIRELLPQWWLLHPADAEQIRQVAHQPPARLVVWLDELQRFLGGSDGLTAAIARALMDRGALLVATLWPDRYTTYTIRPKLGQSDINATERELLGLAYVIHLDQALAAGERQRAEEVAHDDARVALALNSQDYGLTQVIAAAPQLIDHWKSADPYAAAVLNAAVDAARLGVQSPLSADMLRAAAPGYCDARQRAIAPANWFETALAYATAELRGAAAALAPVADPDRMGQTTGYVVADYLQQRATRDRRLVEVPAKCWQALVEYLSDPSDRARVGEAASNRVLFRYAEPLLCSGGQAGAAYLGLMLVGQGRLQEIADFWLDPKHDDKNTAFEVGFWLSLAGQEQALKERADEGDEGSRYHLAALLREQGRFDELRARDDASGTYESQELNRLLFERGQLNELRARAEAGDEWAGKYAARLKIEKLMDAGRLDEASESLKLLDHSLGEGAAYRLAELLAERGREAEAITLLRPIADEPDSAAAHDLAQLLAAQGHEEELRQRADAGDEFSRDALARRLAAQGRERELRDRVREGDGFARARLAELLAEQGRERELRERADAGDDDCSRELAGLLYSQKRTQEMNVRAQAGDAAAASLLARTLYEQGRESEALDAWRLLILAGVVDARPQFFHLLKEKDEVTYKHILRYGLSPEE